MTAYDVTTDSGHGQPYVLYEALGEVEAGI